MAGYPNTPETLEGIGRRDTVNLKYLYAKRFFYIAGLFFLLHNCSSYRFESRNDNFKYFMIYFQRHSFKIPKFKIQV